MLGEILPPLRYSKEKVNLITFHQQGRIPSLYPLSEEGQVVAIVPDQPLRPDILTHWQRDPRNPSEIIFTDPRGELISTATSYLLSPSMIRYIFWNHTFRTNKTLQ